MKLKLDLHVHTLRSPDAFTDFPSLVRGVQRRKLDGIAVTDHNLTCPYTSKDIIIVPGIEISSSHGHVIGIGSMQPVPRGLSPEDAITVMKEKGYAVVAAHPFDWFGRGMNPQGLRTRVDAVETINAGSFPFGRSKKLAEKMAANLGLPTVGGSDSHLPQTIGDAYTEVEVDDTATETIVTAIRRGKTTPKGHPTPIVQRMRKLAYFLELKPRGRKEILES
ncbi:MAG: PHP domain-containing protein [archaeon]